MHPEICRNPVPGVAKARASVPNIAVAERLHYELQLGCYFSIVYDTTEARYAYCDLVDDFIWNHALSNNTPDDKCGDFIASVLSFFHTRGRRPCVYVSERTRPTFLGGQLHEAGFEVLDTELWMFHCRERPVSPASRDLVVAQVNNDATLAAFVAILGQCFKANYTAAVKREFHQYQPHKTVEHVIATAGGTVMGIGSLYTATGHSVIHNVATLPAYRKQGVGTAILDHLSGISLGSGDRILYLQCEAGMEAFYAARGFRTELCRYGYVLDDPQEPRE